MIVVMWGVPGLCSGTWVPWGASPPASTQPADVATERISWRNCHAVQHTEKRTQKLRRPHSIFMVFRRSLEQILDIKGVAPEGCIKSPHPAPAPGSTAGSRCPGSLTVSGVQLERQRVIRQVLGRRGVAPQNLLLVLQRLPLASCMATLSHGGHVRVIDVVACSLGFVTGGLVIYLGSYLLPSSVRSSIVPSSSSRHWRGKQMHNSYRHYQQAMRQWNNDTSPTTCRRRR